MFSVKFDKDFEFDGSCCSVKIKFPDQFFNSTPILFGVKFRDYATAQKRERRLSKIFSRLLLEKGVLLKHWIFLQNLYPGIAEKFRRSFWHSAIVYFVVIMILKIPYPAIQTQSSANLILFKKLYCKEENKENICL